MLVLHFEYFLFADVPLLRRDKKVSANLFSMLWRQDLGPQNNNSVDWRLETAAKDKEKQVENIARKDTVAKPTIIKK